MCERVYVLVLISGSSVFGHQCQHPSWSTGSCIILEVSYPCGQIQHQHSKFHFKKAHVLEFITGHSIRPVLHWSLYTAYLKFDPLSLPPSCAQGRIAFGNHHLPQTLCMNFDDAFLTYTTKPPSSHLDQFMHIVKGSLENVRVMLVPSPRYLGLQNDE